MAPKGTRPPAHRGSCLSIERFESHWGSQIVMVLEDAEAPDSAAPWAFAGSDGAWATRPRRPARHGSSPCDRLPPPSPWRRAKRWAPRRPVPRRRCSAGRVPYRSPGPLVGSSPPRHADHNSTRTRPNPTPVVAPQSATPLTRLYGTFPYIRQECTSVNSKDELLHGRFIKRWFRTAQMHHSGRWRVEADLGRGGVHRRSDPTRPQPLRLPLTCRRGTR